MKNIRMNWRIVFIILFITLMLFALGVMYSWGSGIVDNGRADLTSVDLQQNELVALDGQWEFYWDRLLTPDDFIAEHMPPMDSFMKVPGSWQDRDAGTKIYPDHGVATYRVLINYPSTLKDPALRIQRVVAASKLYANGELIAEVGKVADKPSDYERGYKSIIVDLPKGKQELELIIQVANLDYTRGGPRESPVFGSKQVLERQKISFLALQLLFIGGVLIFGTYYFLLFLVKRKNKTALLFSILCFITALRSSVWGEIPLKIFFPNMSIGVGIYITYITAYSLIPIIIFFVHSIYPLDYNKKIVRLILLPNLFFVVLLLTPSGFMASLNNYHYLLMLLQLIYILHALIKAVLSKRDNAILMFIAIAVFALAILSDVLNTRGIGSITLSYTSLLGNLALIIAMSFVQALEINRDITERKRMEVSLRDSEKRFETCFDTMPDCIEILKAVRDETGRITDFLIDYSNEAACLLEKTTKDAIVGKSYLKLFHDSIKTGLFYQYCQVVETGKPWISDSFIPDNIFYKHIAGVYEGRGSKFQDGVVLSYRNVTKQKKMEQEIIRLDQLNLVGEMAAGLAHEIRNPMTTIKGFLQLLSTKEDCYKYNDYFTLMIGELDRANSIITEYLCVAKDKVVEFELLNLKKIVETILPLIQSDATISDKYIHIELEEVSEISLDKKEMHQLIINLVRNGLEAITPGGTVKIRTFVENEEIVLAVQDDGKGIVPEVLGKIGTPFFTTKDYGTGLGLAVCYSIADRHNAKIVIETGTAGTTFFVRFKK